jgi:hypothetical protein
MAEIERVRYTHDAMIDEILVDPAISQGELARRFGFSQAWISIVINSDSFQARLAERKGTLVDPKITARVEERLESLAKRALDRLLERVESSVPLKPMELVAMAKLGAGDRANRPAAAPQTNNLYVFTAPAVPDNSAKWLASSSRPAPPGVVAEAVFVDRGLTASAGD